MIIKKVVIILLVLILLSLLIYFYVFGGRLSECKLDEKVFLNRIQIFENRKSLIGIIQKNELVCNFDNIDDFINMIDKQEHKEKIYALFILGYLESKPEQVFNLYQKLSVENRKLIALELNQFKSQNYLKQPSYFWSRISLISDMYMN